MKDIPIQYNEQEGRCTEFIGNPTGIIFVAIKSDQEFLLCQRSNEPDVSSNLSNLGW